MIDIFKGGIENFYIYVSLLVMATLIMEFYLSGAYKHDVILFCSMSITAICLALTIFHYVEIAVVFVSFAYVFLVLYSQFFRRR